MCVCLYTFSVFSSYDLAAVCLALFGVIIGRRHLVVESSSCS